MSEIRQYTVYNFDELPDDAKQKALERYRDLHTDDSHWYEHFDYSLSEDLQEFGLCFDSFSFSGFYSQGDGASIKYSISDKFKFIRHLMPSKEDYRIIDRLEKWAVEGLDHDRETQERLGFHYYDDYYAIEFYFEGSNQPLKRLTDFVKRLNKASEDFHKEICHKLYKDLQREYEYLTSDDALSEYFIDNDYLFTAKGEID